MPTGLDRESVRKRLEDFELQPLFIEDLGWDHGGENLEVNVAEKSFRLEAIAHKRGMVAYRQLADSGEDFPDYLTRQKIEKQVTKAVREHIIVYSPHDHSTQHWQWVKREPGQPERTRSHIYNREHSGESLIQKLEHLVFRLDEEECANISDAYSRVRAAFDVERVTRKFYERFKTEHQTFLGFIEGIPEMADREWYASIMLNRMMFIYFIQKRGFLDGDADYLRNRLIAVQELDGNGRFHGFYRLFLMRLFHEGLGQPETDRSPTLAALIGKVPYLNGGLFDVHDLERNNPQIDIPDEAFQQIFDFFDAYQWHLDDRFLHNDDEINPDVLGYIFEKYINQKQMGAYYTKEDITGYIGRNTILPFLFDEAKKHCPIAFTPGGGVWRLLQDDPDSYFYKAVRHGITYDVRKDAVLNEKLKLPPEIAAGLKDVSKRGNWNETAPEEYGLPTETWREHVARRERYEEVYTKLEKGEITSISDLITYNLDIEQFAQDVISSSEGPELVRAFWKAVTSVSILDPTCGSGAFLFAALNILEPVYSACLDSMHQFLEDLKVSKRKHHPESMIDFRLVRDQVASHENETYFILKSIIVENLYGVDIMEEAVEICKLRLFLKLVAQLETYEQIEPLPDIDFNIRAGNTLVGFASLDEVKRALGDDLFMLSELPKIEARAEDADRAFRLFQRMQTEQDMDASDFAAAKAVLREHLDDLRMELDGYLANEHNVVTEEQTAYEKWRGSHKPFHWFVEFKGIMKNGGFDVIIGNPPYVRITEIDYSFSYDYKTLECDDLFALCCERSAYLNNCTGTLAMIVPLNAYSIDSMSNLREFLMTSYTENHLRYFSASDQPSSLFTGVRHRLMVFVNRRSQLNRVTTTRFIKWFGSERDFLFTSIVKCHSIRCDVPQNSKLSSPIEETLVKKVLRKPTLGLWRRKVGSEETAVYYHNAPVHWGKVFDFVPFYQVGNNEPNVSSHVKRLYFETKDFAKVVICFLNSSLFYWWNWQFTNCRDLSVKDIDRSRINLPGFDLKSLRGFSELSQELMVDYRKNSKIYRRVYRGTLTQFDSFYPALSKPIIDKIDSVLAEHYGFTDEEYDFIINYDVKYRMGR